MILGSASKRRSEILGFFSLSFSQIASHFDEETVLFEGDPKAYALTLAKKKGEELTTQFPDELILTADTVVFCEGKLYNKPKNLQEGIDFLSTFSGKWQQVFTAVSVRKGGKIEGAVEETRLLFEELTEQQIHLFLETVNYQDFAGGYTIQGAGELLVQRIEGCYYNIAGLPLQTTKRLLKTMGIDLWHKLNKPS